ncbi:unnamed protein product, partial [Brassica oleracea]
MKFNIRRDGDLSTKQVGVLDQIKISKVFQCDGLLLCALKDYSRLVVWNPYLGQTRWIEPRNSFQSSDRFAFGYDNNINYKILGISIEFHPVSSVCFDFTTENFGPVLPLPFQPENGVLSMSLSCLREDQLVVLYQQSDNTVEISVTDKIGPDVVSWTNFFIDEEKKVAVVFTLELAKTSLYQTAHVIGQDGYFKSARIGEA